MRLTPEQQQAFADQGFLFLPACFTLAEVALLKSELPALFEEDTPARVMEKDGRTVRSVYGPHLTSPIFEMLSRHPRLLTPAMQLLGSAVYLHQFKINNKAALHGDVWEWHQDYVFWLKEDGMLEPRAINVMLVLDELTEFNGPLLFVPGSHQEGVIDVPGRDAIPQEYQDRPAWISNLTADLKYTLDDKTLAQTVKRNGIVAPKGPSGSLLFFHSNVFHASSPNLSPFNRTVVIASYNSVENIPIPNGTLRPEFIAGRDYRPLEPVADDVFSVDHQDQERVASR